MLVSRRTSGYGLSVTVAEALEEIARRLAVAAPGGSEVLLFGSHARDEAHEASDIDLLVIEPAVDDVMAESVRLRRELRGLGVPIDVVVVGREEAERRANVAGTVFERARREGRVLVRSR